MPHLIMNKPAFLSIGINDRGFQIGLDGFTEIDHPRFVGEISAILKQESRYSLLESQLFVRRDIYNVRGEMRVTTQVNTTQQDPVGFCVIRHDPTIGRPSDPTVGIQ
jgi:hypothetical protein